MGWLIPTGMVSKAEEDFEQSRSTLIGRNPRFVRRGSYGRRVRTHAMTQLPAAALNVPAMALSRSKLKPKWVYNQVQGLRATSVPVSALGARVAANRNIKRGDVAVVNPETGQQARRYTIFGRQQF